MLILEYHAFKKDLKTALELLDNNHISSSWYLFLMIIFTNHPLGRHEAGAGMVVPPGDEGREVLQPSLLPVPGHSVSDLSVEASPRDQHCVSDGVRDGAGIAVINNVRIQTL